MGISASLQPAWPGWGIGQGCMYKDFFGFKEKNELKGYITIRLFFPGYKHCEIYWLSVKSKYHGKGIGTKLVKFVETHAKQRGFGKIFAYTNKAMKRTRKFYEKLGYKLINEFPGYYSYPENDTAVLYGKDLL